MTFKRYVTVNKVIDELINANIIDENDCINIYFSDFHKNKYFDKQWTIKPIGFKVIKNIIVKNNGPSVPGSKSLWKVMKKKEKDPEYVEITYEQIHERFPDMEFINVTENKDREFSKLSLTKKLNRLFISCKKQEWRGHNYYMSKLFVNDDEIALKYYEDKWSQQRIDYFNELAKRCSEEEDDDSLEEISIDF